VFGSIVLGTRSTCRCANDSVTNSITNSVTTWRWRAHHADQGHDLVRDLLVCVALLGALAALQHLVNDVGGRLLVLQERAAAAAAAALETSQAVPTNPSGRMHASCIIICITQWSARFKTSRLLLLLLQVGSLQSISPPKSIHMCTRVLLPLLPRLDMWLQLRPHSSAPHPQALLPLPPLPSAALQCPPRTDPPQPHLRNSSSRKISWQRTSCLHSTTL
jgi:hypothetical protein